MLYAFFVLCNLYVTKVCVQYLSGLSKDPVPVKLVFDLMNVHLDRIEAVFIGIRDQWIAK